MYLLYCRDVFSEKLSAFEKRDNFTVSRTTVTNSNQGRVLDKKVWSPNAALNNMATSEMPNTNPEVHIISVLRANS